MAATGDPVRPCAGRRRDSSRGQVLVLFALGSGPLRPPPGSPSTSAASTASGASSRTQPTPARSPPPTPSSAASTDARRPKPRPADVLARNFTHRARTGRRQLADDPRSTSRATPATRSTWSTASSSPATEVRVAVQNPIRYTFGRVVGLDHGHDRRPGPGADERATSCRSPSATSSTRPARTAARPPVHGRASRSRTSVDAEHGLPRHARRTRRSARRPSPGRRSTRAHPGNDPRTTGRSSRSSARGPSPATAPTSAASSPSTSATSRSIDVERLLQRRHVRDEREHAQGRSRPAGSASRRVSRARTSRPPSRRPTRTTRSR